MKVLVTGVAGQLGYDVCRVLAERNILYAGTDAADCDITDAQAVKALFEREKPDAVIHCAAYTAVDKAEENTALAFAVNETGTRNLAMECKAWDAKMLYISTDCVFPGAGEQFYEVDDAKGPLNVYGKSKLAGELAVQELLEKYFIVRISWAFGKNGTNFVKTMLQLSQSKDEIGVVDDQVGGPTYTADLAPLLCDMIVSEKYGVYHAPNEGSCSWAEFAEEIFRLVGRSVKVNYLASRDYPAKAVRPHNSKLSTKSLDKAGFLRLPHWHDALKRYLTEMGYPIRKRIAVIGAGGYIGRHVVPVLCEMGADVVAVDWDVSEIDSRAQKLQMDIFGDEKAPYERLRWPDACLHMAWREGFVHDSDAHMADLSKHYMFIRNMLEGGLKQLAVMGTMHEVGYFEGAINEDTPCNPTSMYGIAKDALRRSTFQMAQGRAVCIQWLRAYYIYGDDRNNHSIFTKLTQAEERGEKRFPFTTGKNQYDFIAVEELARQLAAVVMQTKVSGIINCCSGKPVSLAEQVESFIRESGFSIKLEYGAFPERAYDSPAVWGDNQKIQQILRECTFRAGSQA